jgi:hypothetical protein
MSKKDKTKETKKAEPKKVVAKKEETPKEKPNKLASAIDSIAKKAKAKIDKVVVDVTTNAVEPDIDFIVDENFGKEEKAPEITITEPIIAPEFVSTPTAPISNNPVAPIRNLNELMAENQLNAFASSLEGGLKNNNSLKRHGIMPFKEISTMVESSPTEYAYEIIRENDLCAVMVKLKEGVTSQRVPKNESEWFKVY